MERIIASINNTKSARSHAAMGESFPQPMAVDVPTVEEIEKVLIPKLPSLLPPQSEDPVNVYPKTYGLDADWPTPPSVGKPDPGLGATYDTFRLAQRPVSKLSRNLNEDHLDGMTAVQAYITRIKSKFVGFQARMDLDFDEPMLSQYLNCHMNNIGDPFAVGSFNSQTKFLERPLLDYFAQLWHGDFPHSRTRAESYWGFVLTMGGTEGNLYAMWNGRDYLSGKVMIVDLDQNEARSSRRKSKPAKPQYVQPKMAGNEGTPIAFFSSDTHYSLSKCMVILNIQTFAAEGREKYRNDCPIQESSTGPRFRDGWPDEVPSNADGSINLDALEKLVEFFVSKKYPILINFNYGTTFLGAYDDVYSAGKRLEPILRRHGMWERQIEVPELPGDRKIVTRNGFWFHVDGALGAAYMPFVEMAYECKLIEKKGPSFDFRNEFVHSIAMSGHKWIGAPFPCGVFMTKTKYQLNPPEIPNYIGSPDTTFAGSRGALGPMFLWNHFAKHSISDLVHRALYTERIAEYMKTTFTQVANAKPDLKLDVRRSPLSLAVTFRRPKNWIVHKYTLSKEEMDGKLYVHAYAMAHVTEIIVNALAQDLLHEEAFPSEDELPADVGTEFAGVPTDFVFTELASW